MRHGDDLMIWHVDDDGSVYIRVRGNRAAMRSFLTNLADSAPLPRPCSGTVDNTPSDAVVYRGSVHINDVAQMREYLVSISSQLRQR
jgi:hypothetical protein